MQIYFSFSLQIVSYIEGKKKKKENYIYIASRIQINNQFFLSQYESKPCRQQMVCEKAFRLHGVCGLMQPDDVKALWRHHWSEFIHAVIFVLSPILLLTL